METETVDPGVRNVTKPTRKISTDTKYHPPLGPTRKISNMMLASDAFRDVIQPRGGRKISSSIFHHFQHKVSEEAMEAKINKEKIENTYKLEPDMTFPYCRVREIITETLKRHLDGMDYDQKESPLQAKIISDDIKSKVKALSIDRYRVICLVHIGSDTGQEMRFVSRALWNPGVDTFATSEFKTGKLFAVATVFAVYFE
ncbi:dynein light chain Tctex-type 5-like [Rhopilema esculentum]|uniref:dynein light chain Tctex-type 5-like n=1 Tax=Rhopilema esculentum TaxID=499914 RepID=UPI0031E08264|eukprot:gene4549-20801_t